METEIILQLRKNVKIFRSISAWLARFVLVMLFENHLSGTEIESYYNYQVKSSLVNVNHYFLELYMTCWFLITQNFFLLFVTTLKYLCLVTYFTSLNVILFLFLIYIKKVFYNKKVGIPLYSIIDSPIHSKFSNKR